jgi:hypothetical protein
VLINCIVSNSVALYEYLTNEEEAVVEPTSVESAESGEQELTEYIIAISINERIIIDFMTR